MAVAAAAVVATNAVQISINVTSAEGGTAKSAIQIQRDTAPAVRAILMVASRRS